MTAAEESGFTVDVDLNPYLAEGATQVDAVVTVTGPPAGSAAPTSALEIIVVDCSSSMSGHKIRAAQQAASAAVGVLRDGVTFAIIAGTQTATQVYPAQGTAVADTETRAAAARAIATMRANGGTGIGSWLVLSGQIAASSSAAVKHAILLTDGQNGETDRVFTRALESVTGAFVCDCRGVGTDWKVSELRRISSALLGTVDIVADPDDLADDFAAIMNTSMGKTVSEVALRLWVPRGGAVRFVKQVTPSVEDLTGRRTDVSELVGDYPLGAWGEESRDYHVSVDVAPGGVQQKKLAARVTLVRAGSDEQLGGGMVVVEWTDDPALSTRINRSVAVHTGQAELAEAIQEGLAARKAGDEARATARLGRAAQLADELGNEGTARLLARVVDVVDAPSGTVRLRAGVSEADEMTLDTRSTKTVRVRPEGA
ncbi:VWA domain-containing protein [Pseudonocardia sp. CA-107938]|uniref:vWA domain-containing protein n=1 Tax=Pseudonocardia sp. CA-107938 TaxID=3240021 RepID=UPI003D90C862